MSDRLKFGLKQQTIDNIKKCIFRNKKIKIAIVYGSRAKGNHHPGSDIDITLKGKALTFDDLFQLDQSLDELMLPYTFDLSIYDQIDNPDLLEHIDRVGKIL